MRMFCVTDMYYRCSNITKFYSRNNLSISISISPFLPSCQINNELTKLFGIKGEFGYSSRQYANARNTYRGILAVHKATISCDE